MLAAIDWNNSSRQQEQDEEGQRKMCMRYTKRGREFVLRKVYNYKKMKTEQEYFYYILFTIQSGSLRTHHLSSGTSCVHDKHWYRPPSSCNSLLAKCCISI